MGFIGSTCTALPRVGVSLKELPPPATGPGTGVIENNVSTARSTFARAWVNAHTYARTRFVIAGRPQTIVWAFTLSLRTSILWRSGRRSRRYSQ